jgi:LysM repeat protein
LSEFNPDERLAFILKAVFEFPIAEVAKICHQDSSDLEQNFTLIYRRIQTELQPAIPDVPSRQIDELLKEYANRRWPVPEASEQDLQRTAQAVAELVSKQNSARQRRSVLLEIAGIGLALIAIFITVQFSETILPSASAPSPAAGLPAPSLPWSPKVYYQVQPGDSLESIARKTGVTLAELSSMNAISSTLDLYEGQELAISVPGIREVSAGLPLADLTPTVQPLTLESGPAEIRKRLTASSRYWTSLWMDTQEASGSLEPSMTNGTEYLRRQIWIQQPDRSYEITNYLRGSDAMDYYRAIVFKGQGYYAFGSNSPFFWDGDWRIPPGELLYNPYLQEMVFPGQSSLVAVDRRYQVVRQSEVAGRKVLLVDTWRPGDEFQRRIWVDVQTGLILRYQVEFPDYKGQKDFIVTALAYNIPIPPALFDPRQPKSGGFAMDYSGWAPAPDLLRATDTPAFSLAPSPTP